MRRRLVGRPEGAGGLLLLLERRDEFAVLQFQRENALLKVGDNRVEGVGEAFAVGDALFQLLTGGVGFLAHGRSIAQGVRGGQCLAATSVITVLRSPAHCRSCAGVVALRDRVITYRHHECGHEGRINRR